MTSNAMLYVLKLKDNKWYVGVTNDMTRRMAEHFNGRGSAWTRRYKAVVISKKYAVSSSNKHALESKEVASLMWQHGVNNVRGAEFCNKNNFTMRDKEGLVRFIGHHLDQPYSEVEKWLLSQLCCGDDEDAYSTSDGYEDFDEDKDACFRCGRTSHWANNCFAKYHLDGTRLH